MSNQDNSHGLGSWKPSQRRRLRVRIAHLRPSVLGHTGKRHRIMGASRRRIRKEQQMAVEHTERDAGTRERGETGQRCGWRGKTPRNGLCGSGKGKCAQKADEYSVRQPSQCDGGRFMGRKQGSEEKCAGGHPQSGERRSEGMKESAPARRRMKSTSLSATSSG